MNINIGFAIAAGLSGLAVIAHAAGGVRGRAGPLMASSLPPAAKWLLWTSLHMVTLINLTLTLCFWWAAVNFQGRAAASALTAFALAASLLGLVAALRGRLGWSGLGLAMLYALIFVAGAWGCYGSFLDGAG